MRTAPVLAGWNAARDYTGVLLPAVLDDPGFRVLAAVRCLHPGLAVTGYATGEELEAMLARGFTALGPQRVWVR